MGEASEQAEALAVIRSALVSGTHVEDLMEQVIPRVPDRGEPSGLGARLWSLGKSELAPGGAESIRRIADGLDRFAVDLVRAGTGFRGRFAGRLVADNYRP